MLIDSLDGLYVSLNLTFPIAIGKVGGSSRSGVLERLCEHNSRAQGARPIGTELRWRCTASMLGLLSTGSLHQAAIPSCLCADGTLHEAQILEGPELSDTPTFSDFLRDRRQILKRDSDLVTSTRGSGAARPLRLGVYPGDHIRNLRLHSCSFLLRAFAV